jgi:multiple sugar transport system permease protein
MVTDTWRQMGPRARREALEGYLGIAPWAIGFLAFTFGPMLASMYFSLTQWDIVRQPIFIGLNNYIKLFTDDPLFYQALKVTLTYVIISVPLKLVAGLGLALLLNMKIKGMNVFRTLFYVPAVLSGVAVALMWIWIMHPEMGVINMILDRFGIKGPMWFWAPETALLSVVIMNLWYVGGSAVIYLAGLQNIPPTLYEAAEIDGANSYQRFRRVTLPLLTPTLFLLLITGLIDAFQVFTSVYVITKGGPLKATYFYMLYLYQTAFEDFNMGYASAMAWILTIIIVLCSVIVFRTSTRWVYYEDSGEAGK